MRISNFVLFPPKAVRDYFLKKVWDLPDITSFWPPQPVPRTECGAHIPLAGLLVDEDGKLKTYSVGRGATALALGFNQAFLKDSQRKSPCLSNCLTI